MSKIDDWTKVQKDRQNRTGEFEALASAFQLDRKLLQLPKKIRV